VEPGAGVRPGSAHLTWSAATVYVGGETVTYLGRTFQALWWTSVVTPGTAWSAWKALA
jgi:chitodextrinase